MTEQATEAAYGRFVWHDLMTPDPEGAKAFYTALLGWTVQEVPMKHPDGEGATYAMFHVDGQGIGGIEPADPAKQIPPHWLGYCEVADVDAAQGKAVEAGGAVLVPAMDIPGVGRFCVIRDPQGGALAPFQSASGKIPDPAGGKVPDGCFCWNELLTRDTASCAAFYPQVMGWTVEEMPMPEATYHLFKRGPDGQDPYCDAGMMQMPPGAEAPTHWLHYVQVADVDATVAQAQELGAAMHCPPTDIPQVGRFAVLADPQGASFAVFQGAAQAS